MGKGLEVYQFARRQVSLVAQEKSQGSHDPMRLFLFIASFYLLTNNSLFTYKVL